MKKLIVMLLALTVMLSAALVDENRAINLAESHYKAYAPADLIGNTAQRIIPRVYNGEVTMYTVVFNDGFVIVNAEDNLKPILGWSYKTIKEIPDNFQPGPAFESWFGVYDKQIVEARQIGYVNADAVKEWKKMEAGEFTKGAKGIVIDALIESHWDQEYPYNDQCPSLGEPEGNCVVGCVATSTSLVMRYHEQDVQGYGSSSYYWSAGGQTLSIDHSTQTFDYSLMPHSGYSTQAEVDELAKLAMNVGYSVSMQYDTRDTGGSGAFTADVDNALLDHFGYATANYYSHGTPATATPSWVSTIETSLDNLLPVIYAGSGGDGGHCFNLDGYTDDNWYHFNWGWGGYYDGWYQLDNLNPGSDFTQSQQGVYNVEHTPWPWNEPTNFGGSIANGEDITLTWTAPNPGTKTLTGYEIYRFGTLYDTVGLVTSYQDFDLSPAEYTYYIKAVYEDGVSHMTNSYSQSVVADENYPLVTGLATVVNGRVSIDVSWIKPFTGAVYLAEDWETTSFENDWTQQRTTSKPPSQNSFSVGAIVDDPKWFHEDGSGLGPEYIHSGLWAVATGYTTANFTWLFSPLFNIGADAQLTYWVWCTGDSGNGWLTNYYIDLYNGDFTERRPADFCYNVASYIGIDETTANQWDSAVTVDLSSYTGDYYIAFVYEYTDGYQMAIDDIMIGATAKKTSTYVRTEPAVNPERLESPATLADTSGLPSPVKAAKADEPTSYDVYRNGVVAANVAVTGGSEVWNDTGFADGANVYKIKANYPTGTSLACNPITAMMDANPVPGYLADSGILDANADLSWYAPYHYPPMWFGYNGEDPDSYWDMIADYFAVGDHLPGEKNRTLFNMDLGIYYPADLDSVAACFYEDVDYSPWGSSNFYFNVYTAAFDGSDSMLYDGSSNTQTASSGYWTLMGLPATITNNQGWYIEIVPGDGPNTGTPSIFTTYTNDSHSTTYLDVAGDGTGYGWYYITSGDYNNEWWINGFITSSAPPAIVKDGWTSPIDKVTMDKYESVLAEAREVSTPATSMSKEMLNYNIYRDGGLIGTSATTTYQDATASGGFHDYYVTALYANPAGESVASNTVNVEISGSGPVIPAVPANVVTSIVGTDLQIDWDVSADATGYDVYSSDDPYGTFGLVTSVGTNQYTVAADQAKMFYYIIATNATKATAKEIKVANPVKSVK